METRLELSPFGGSLSERMRGEEEDKFFFIFFFVFLFETITLRGSFMFLLTQ